MTILYWGRRETVPCSCGDVSLFSASLISQPWMQDKSHVPATVCRCGKSYHAWALNKSFVAKTRDVA